MTDDPTTAAERLARYRPWLVLLARLQLSRRLGAKLDASDAAQQALLEACRTFPQFRGTTEAELTAWLRAILAHVLAHEVVGWVAALAPRECSGCGR